MYIKEKVGPAGLNSCCLPALALLATVAWLAPPSLSSCCPLPCAAACPLAPPPLYRCYPPCGTITTSTCSSS